MAAKSRLRAPDEGRRARARKASAARDVAGAGPGLDEGRPLPVLADALVVVERRRRPAPRAGSRPGRAAAAGRCGRRSRRRCAPASGPTAAGSGARRRPAGSTPSASGRRVGLEEDRDVDVAGVVELEGALLAHGDAEPAGDRPLRARRPAGSAGRPPAPPRAATASAAATAASAKRVRAPVTWSRSQTPPRSAERGQQMQLGLQLAQRAGRGLACRAPAHGGGARAGCRPAARPDRPPAGPSSRSGSRRARPAR